VDKISQAKLSKQQKTILGWAYVLLADLKNETHPSWYDKIDLHRLKRLIIPRYRKPEIRIKFTKNSWRLPLECYNWLWYIKRSDSASFSKSLKRLEARGLIVSETWRGLRRQPGEVLTRDVIRFTTSGREIAQQLLTRSMKRKITVNKKMRPNKKLRGGEER